jgi:hypothetical protein
VCVLRQQQQGRTEGRTERVLTVVCAAIPALTQQGMHAGCAEAETAATKNQIILDLD